MKLENSLLFPRPVKNASARPLFITGAPRCGSSWVGEVLGNCINTRYVYEPFNPEWVPAVNGKLTHFTYFDESSDPSTDIRQNAEKAFQGLQNWKQLARAAYRGYWHVATRNAAMVIIKDPTASMMTAWLAKHFNPRVLFIMRHPCGFASSMEALDWSLGVNGLLRQEALMRNHLQPYEALIQNASNDKWLTRGAIWAAIHVVYARQQVDHPDWLLFKYEDICVDPFGQFDDMTSKTGLEMGEKTRRKIQVLSASSRSDPGSTQRNSKSMPDVWRQRMSPGEIDAVMGVVSEFGLDYY